MRISLLLIVLFVSISADRLVAQTLDQRAVVPAGGSGENGGTSLGWTIGQPASATYADGSHAVTAGVQQPEGFLLSIRILSFLDGPYDPAQQLMHDSLRVRGLIPVNEPYSALGLGPVGLQFGSRLIPGALMATGSDAIVDWVHVELRSATDGTLVIAARSALLQRDGDIVEVDGVSPIRMTATPGSYRVALLHRNHLPVLTQAALLMGPGLTTLNLTDGSLSAHVPDAFVVRNGRYLLWAGDVTGDGSAKYSGTDNDRDPVLFSIGGAVPTNTVSGYLPEDTNLDGAVKYVGAGNDRDIILQTIGGNVPTNVREQPLP